MSKHIWVLALALLLLPLGMAHAADFICGDAICSNFADYNETDPLSTNYCPRDCGSSISDRWCEDTYTLIRTADCPTCPTCGGCSPCDTSRISETDLRNWCTTTGGYIPSSSCTNGSLNGANATGGELDVWIIWLIFLIIGLILGYIIWGKKKKRGK